ncbi:hypothetical protein ACSSUQ_004207 [Yersinia enterocolitica]
MNDYKPLNGAFYLNNLFISSLYAIKVIISVKNPIAIIVGILFVVSKYDAIPMLDATLKIEDVIILTGFSSIIFPYYM